MSAIGYKRQKTGTSAPLSEEKAPSLTQAHAYAESVYHTANAAGQVAIVCICTPCYLTPSAFINANGERSAPLRRDVRYAAVLVYVEATRMAQLWGFLRKDMLHRRDLTLAHCTPSFPSLAITSKWPRTFNMYTAPVQSTDPLQLSELATARPEITREELEKLVVERFCLLHDALEHNTSAMHDSPFGLLDSAEQVVRDSHSFWLVQSLVQWVLTHPPPPVAHGAPRPRPIDATTAAKVYVLAEKKLFEWRLSVCLDTSDLIAPALHLHNLVRVAKDPSVCGFYECEAHTISHTPADVTETTSADLLKLLPANLFKNIPEAQTSNTNSAWLSVPFQFARKLLSDRKQCILHQGRVYMSGIQVKEFVLQSFDPLRVLHDKQADFGYFSRYHPALMWHRIANSDAACEFPPVRKFTRTWLHRLIETQDKTAASSRRSPVVVRDLEDLGKAAWSPPCLRAMHAKLSSHTTHLGYRGRGPFIRILLEMGKTPEQLVSHYRAPMTQFYGRTRNMGATGAERKLKQISLSWKYEANKRLCSPVCDTVQREGLCPFRLSAMPTAQCIATMSTEAARQEATRVAQNYKWAPRRYIEIACSAV